VVPKAKPQIQKIQIAPDRVTVYRKSNGEKVVLTKSNYVASGGEGHVFERGGVSFKICHPGHMMPVDKIRELSVLTSEFIANPDDILVDDKKKPIGYTAPFVKDAYSISELFSTDFWDDHGLTPEIVIGLIRKWQDGIAHVHRKGILVIDVNEYNFLTRKGFKNVYFIDTNSYQTPGSLATVILPTVEDRHMKKGKFTELTDWFSWAVVTFHTLIGIHPYKGFHPKYGDLDARMKKNITVFDPEVTFPSSCRDFSVIPEGLQRWYDAVLVKGERIPPPDSYELTVIVVPKVRKITGGVKFEVERILSFQSDVVRAYAGPNMVVLTKNGFSVGGRMTSEFIPKVAVGFSIDKGSDSTGLGLVTSDGFAV